MGCGELLYCLILSTAKSQYFSFISKPTNFRLFESATIALVPDPRNGSNTIQSGLLETFTIRSISAIGNCAGCGILSFELRFAPEVTFGICQTSVGFLPKGLHLSFPFFF